MSRAAAFPLVVAILLAAPTGLAVGNRATVEAGEQDAVAVCQLLILVNAVIILGLEDSLGLVGASRGTPADVIAIVAAPGSGQAASCSAGVGELRLETGGAPLPPSYVGGAVALDELAPAAESAGRTNVAVCQHLVLVGSVVLGGASFGLPAGYLAPVSVFSSLREVGGDATCDVRAPTIVVE